MMSAPLQAPSRLADLAVSPLMQTQRSALANAAGAAGDEDAFLIGHVSSHFRVGWCISSRLNFIHPSGRNADVETGPRRLRHGGR